MPPGRKIPALQLADDQRVQLESLAKSTSMPHGLVQRAKIVLACAEGVTNATVADQVGVSASTVGKWRRRYLLHGIEGLHDELRSGRPRTYGDEKVAGLINRALQEKPPHGNAWTVRTMAEAEGVSSTTVHRWFKIFGLKPHQ